MRRVNVCVAPSSPYQTSETTVFDREKNELLTDRKMTLSAPNISDKQLLTQSYLSDGALYQSIEWRHGRQTGDCR